MKGEESESVRRKMDEEGEKYVTLNLLSVPSNLDVVSII
jgi:hypothetical protein